MTNKQIPVKTSAQVGPRSLSAEATRADENERAILKEREAAAWHGVLRRPVVAYLVAIGITILTTLILLLLGPRAVASTGWFIATFVTVCVTTGLGFCLRRRWRPAVSNASAAVAIGFAWFTTEMSTFADPASARTTVMFILGALGFALAYALLFRPLGEQINREESEATVRRIIREELERARHHAPESE